MRIPFSSLSLSFFSANCPISEMGTKLSLCSISTSCLKTEVYIICWHRPSSVARDAGTHCICLAVGQTARQ